MDFALPPCLLVGEAEDIRQLVIDPLVLFVACKVHHASRDVLGSVIWCSCAFARLPCFKSLVLGCDGIVYFIIPSPSFTSPPVGHCCSTYLLSCLQQTCFSFAQISSVVVATSVSTSGTCALKNSWNQLHVCHCLSISELWVNLHLIWGDISIIMSHTRSWCCRALFSPGITFTFITSMHRLFWNNTKSLWVAVLPDLYVIRWLSHFLNHVLLRSRARGYKTWVHSQTQNKAQWLAACRRVSASSQSLRFILSLRL